MPQKQNWRPLALVTLLLTPIFVWAYWPTLVRILQIWRSDPDYTHGFLVIPLAAAILWRNRTSQKPAESAASESNPRYFGGLLLLALVGLIRVLTGRFYLLELDAWSIPLWLGGAIWFTLGGHHFRWAWPALAFLWFAAPIPSTFEQLLSVPLQLRAAGGSAWILQCLGQPAVEAGTTLLLGTQVLEVEQACSGLRMFIGTYAMAVAYILLSHCGRWRALTLLVLAAPIAVLANIVRIVITALLYQYASDEIARRFAHDFAGLLMIALACLSFYGAMKCFDGVAARYLADRDHFLPRLAVVPVIVVALAIVAIVWHDRQVESAYQSLLATATQYETANEWSAAARSLQRYLQFEPNQPAIVRRYAIARVKSATLPQEQAEALSALAAAWKANSNDLELGIELARLAFERRQFVQVVDTCERLLNQLDHGNVEQAALVRESADLRARAMYDSLVEQADVVPYTWSQVKDVLEDAIELDPANPAHAYRLAIVYRDRLTTPGASQRNQLADDQIDQLVARNADSEEAWLARYRYRRLYHRNGAADVAVLTSIDGDLDRAVALDEASPEPNVHILVASAERMRERGLADESLNVYQSAMRANPLDVRPYLAIAEIRSERSTPEDREAALDVLNDGLEAIGREEVSLMFPMIEQLVVLDRNEEADRLVAEAGDRILSYLEPAATTLTIQLQHVNAWRIARGGEFVEAAKTLATFLDSLTPNYAYGSPKYVSQSWANVGQYYRMGHAWEHAAEAYQRAAILDESWRLEYRWALAQKTEAEGNLEEAVRQFGEIAAEADDPAEAWLQAAAVALRQQILLPTQLRDWTQFRRALDEVRQLAGAREDERVVLEANQLLVVGQRARAVELLETARANFPTSLAIHRSLALVQSRSGDPDQALETVRSLPDDDSLWFEKLKLSKQILIDHDRYDEAIKLLQDALVRADEGQLCDLHLEAAEIEMLRGRWRAARDQLDLAADVDPHDLRITESLSQLAWCTQDWALLQECESVLQVVEGTFGPMWRAHRIRRILAQSEDRSQGTTTASDEASLLVSQLESLHPQMQQTRIAAGRVATYRGMLWSAVANYEEAWSLGVPRIGLAVDLVGLLNELGQTERAQRYVFEIRRYLQATDQIVDDQYLDLAGESVDQAVKIAEAAASEHPSAPAYVRLGRTLVLTAVPGSSRERAFLDRAEQAFSRAVEIDPRDPRSWAALFRFFAAVRNDPIKSQQMLASLRTLEAISPLDRAFTLAQLYESIGNLAEADRLYRESIDLAAGVEASGERLVVLERAALFYRTIDRQRAEDYCRQALSIDENAVGPLRVIVELLLEQGTLESIAEAKELYQRVVSRSAESDEPLRLQARLLMREADLDPVNRETLLEEALSLVQQVTNRVGSDALMLADVHLRLGRLTPAVNLLRQAAEDLPNDNLETLRFLERFDNQLHTDTRLRLLASLIYDRLEEQPDIAFLTLDQRLRTSIARMPEESAAQQQTFAMATIDQFARRQIARCETDDERFGSVTALMAYLLRSGRVDAAFRLSEATPELLMTPRSASALASALAITSEDRRTPVDVDKQFGVLMKLHAEDFELSFCVGNLVLMQGDYDRAAGYFQRAAELSAGNPFALNNLALCLTLGTSRDFDRAAEILQSLNAQADPPVAFTDTLAVLHLLQNEPQLAVERLLKVLSSPGIEGTPFLHLSEAWNGIGETEMARYAFQMAVMRNVGNEPLIPFDRQLFDKLSRQFQEQ